MYTSVSKFAKLQRFNMAVLYDDESARALGVVDVERPTKKHDKSHTYMSLTQYVPFYEMC